MEIEEKVSTLPVTFTQNAWQELKRLELTLDLSESQYLRIGVKGGGCSGLSYLLAFDKMEEKDNVYVHDGINIVMNKAHIMYLLGMQIDWENGLNNRGFVFVNPNAKESCGCGQSFST